MKKMIPALLLLPILAFSADPQQKEPPKDVPTELRHATEVRDEARKAKEIGPMVEAERAFAKASEEKGMRQAFLEYLAEDAVIFRPGPVKGRQWFQDQEEIGGTLSWGPTYAELASSGELGFSTGPFRFEQAAPEGKPAAAHHGHFVSIWEKKVVGWRVILDHGILHNELKEVPELETRFSGEKRREVPDLRAAGKVLFEADGLFAGQLTEETLKGTYEAHAADDVRLYRDGLFPVVGKKKAMEYLTRLPTLLESELNGAGMSRAQDLAYSFGTGTAGKINTSATNRVSYLHIWRKAPDGSWKLTLDLMSPLPELPPQPAPAAEPAPPAEPPANPGS
jgi:ketosteroid isomerase-like protein